MGMGIEIPFPRQPWYMLIIHSKFLSKVYDFRLIMFNGLQHHPWLSEKSKIRYPLVWCSSLSEAHAFVRISKLSFVRIALTVTCPNQYLG